MQHYKLSKNKQILGWAIYRKSAKPFKYGSGVNAKPYDRCIECKKATTYSHLRCQECNYKKQANDLKSWSPGELTGNGTGILYANHPLTPNNGSYISLDKLDIWQQSDYSHQTLNTLRQIKQPATLGGIIRYQQKHNLTFKVAHSDWMQGIRTCNMCDGRIPARAMSRTGGRCKKCDATRARNLRHADPTKYRAISRANEKQYRAKRTPVWKANKKRGDLRRRGTKIIDLDAKEWETIKQLFDYKCAYCDKSSTKISMDHVTPITKGGNHVYTNIVPSCRPCNSSKTNKDLRQWLNDEQRYDFILQTMGDIDYVLAPPPKMGHSSGAGRMNRSLPLCPYECLMSVS